MLHGFGAFLLSRRVDCVFCFGPHFRLKMGTKGSRPLLLTKPAIRFAKAAQTFVLKPSYRCQLPACILCFDHDNKPLGIEY